jgi:methyl coenzyme M reductase system subunit A2
MRDASLLLKIEALSKRYCACSVNALDSVTFSVKKGEIVGIVGESGAGKTTLLRILKGVEPFDSGKITFEDLEIEPTSPESAFLEFQRRTAIQLQRSFGLWPESTIDNVVRALRYVRIGEESIPHNESEYEEMRQKAFEILKVVGLEKRSDLWSQVLSGGEKQRLIIARQIARKPKLLLLDEPGTMTDPASREGLVSALKKVNAELGVSIVYASHNPLIHRSLTERLLLLDDGKIKDDGKTEEVLSKFLSKLEPVKPKVEINGPAVLRMKGVTKLYEIFSYGKVFELENTELEFRRGEIVGIIGPSSAGKTVILRMLAGLELPDRGEVDFLHRGEWITMGHFGRKSLHARTHIGMLHQEFDLPHWAKVLDLFAARLGIKDYEMLEAALKEAKKAGIREEIVDALSRAAELPESEMSVKLNEMGLEKEVIQELFKSKDPEKARDVALTVLREMNLDPSILDKSVYELSGGEKIRVALALSLVFNPRALILDEPFGDLDPLTLRKVANSLKRAKMSLKPAIILVSHQLDFVEEVSDRCILIREGKVVMQGNPSEVINHFQRLMANEPRS